MRGNLVFAMIGANILSAVKFQVGMHSISNIYSMILRLKPSKFKDIHKYSTIAKFERGKILFRFLRQIITLAIYIYIYIYIPRPIRYI